MSYRIAILESLLVLAVAACINADARTSDSASVTVRDSAAGAVDPIGKRSYGIASKLGNGSARTYITYDVTGAPTEVGVSLDEAALEGLPAPMKMSMPANDGGHEHLDSHVFNLALPVDNPTPYRFVELDWNPGGHEPPGVYDTPHFDFHFYRVAQAVRDGIDPARFSKAQYIEKSGNLPPKDEWAPQYAALSAPGTPVMAVPRMGTHWVDIVTPELQAMFGHPEQYRRFTTTFLHGSWDGQFIFDEPMVTREFIISRKAGATEAVRDSVIQLASPKKYDKPGYYPGAYRVMYDAATKEYRIALTQLSRKN